MKVTPGNMKGFGPTIALLVVLAVTSASATPLPAASPGGGTGLGGPDRPHPRLFGVDVGLEIHKMHLRKNDAAVEGPEGAGAGQGRPDGDGGADSRPSGSRSSVRDEPRVGGTSRPPAPGVASELAGLEEDLQGVGAAKLAGELGELGGSPGEETEPSDLALDLLVLDEYITKLTESPHLDTTVRFPSEPDLGSGSSGLRVDEPRLPDSVGMPRQALEDQLAHLESSGGTLDDSLRPLPIKYSSVENVLVEGSGAGESGDDEPEELIVEFLESEGSGIARKSSGLFDELRLLDSAKVPLQDSQDPSWSGDGSRPGVLELEDQLAQLESSGSPLNDFLNPSPIKYSSTEFGQVEGSGSAGSGDGEQAELIVEFLESEGSGIARESWSGEVEGSGSGGSGDGDLSGLWVFGGFLKSDGSRLPDGSGSGSLSGDGGPWLSGSGLSSGDSADAGLSAEGGHRGITLSSIPRDGFGAPADKPPPAGEDAGDSPKLKPGAPGPVPLAVLEVRHGKASRAGQAEEQGTQVVSVEERLELELDELSVVVSKTAGGGDGDGQLASSTQLFEDNFLSTPMTKVQPVGQPSLGSRCRGDEMSCGSGLQCVPAESACDLVADCSDGSDEAAELCDPSRKCQPGFFKCGPSAQCVSQEARCDGIYQCHNGEDEKDCIPGSCQDPRGRQRQLTVEDICDGVKDCQDGSDENKQRCRFPCPSGHRKCQDGLQCVKEELFCNGIHNCRDKSDETACDRTSSDCLDLEMFACDGLCLPRSALCDSTYDCRDGSDELGCGND